VGGKPGLTTAVRTRRLRSSPRGGDSGRDRQPRRPLREPGPARPHRELTRPGHQRSPKVFSYTYLPNSRIPSTRVLPSNRTTGPRGPFLWPTANPPARLSAHPATSNSEIWLRSAIPPAAASTSVPPPLLPHPSAPSRQSPNWLRSAVSPAAPVHRGTSAACHTPSLQRPPQIGFVLSISISPPRLPWHQPRPPHPSAPAANPKNWLRSVNFHRGTPSTAAPRHAPTHPPPQAANPQNGFVPQIPAASDSPLPGLAYH